MVIGIIGPKESGKSTMAKAIQHMVAPDINIEIRPFGDGVKAEVYDYLSDLQYLFLHDKPYNFGRIKNAGLPKTELEMLVDDREAVWRKPTTPAVRKLLQWWGTDYRRASDSDYWVKYWVGTDVDYITNQYIVVDDIRFPNEATHILGYPDSVLFALPLESNDTHASEDFSWVKGVGVHHINPPRFNNPTERAMFYVPYIAYHLSKAGVKWH